MGAKEPGVKDKHMEGIEGNDEKQDHKKQDTATQLGGWEA